MGDELSVPVQLVRWSRGCEVPALPALLSAGLLELFSDSDRSVPAQSITDLSRRICRERREKIGDFKSLGLCSGCVATGSSSSMEVSTAGNEEGGGWC